MKASYIKFIVIAVIAGLFIFSLILTFSKKASPGKEPDTRTALTIPTQNGQVQVNDITKNPVKVLDNDFVIADNAQYSILYFAKDKTFLITILSQPVQQNRNLAEAELVTKLGIADSDACKLKVSLTVPNGVDEKLSGQDYGLSFCPTGAPF